MPGAQDRWDQLADPNVRSQEPLSQLDPPRIADRPERGSLVDLRHRLERLPAGHPSSPYNDDLSRKPPVARLKDLELPLQGSERDTNGTARQHEHDPGQGASAFQPGPLASHNGSVGGNHAEAGLATGGQTGTDRSSTTGWSTTTDWTPAGDGRSSPADQSSGPAEGRSGPADPSSPTTDLSSIIARLRTSDRVSADDPPDADEELGASEPLGTGDGLATHDRLGHSDQPGADDRPRLRERLASDAEIGGDNRLGLDNGIGSGDRSGADQAIGADDGLSGADGVGARRWSSTDHLSAADDEAVSANGASVTDWTIAADEVGAEDGPGAAHWSNADDLSNTAEWNRNSDWNNASEWDGSPHEWDGSASHDSATRATWLEPAPAMDPRRRAAAAMPTDHLADEPRTGLDGSWEWNGRYLTPDECQIADEALNRIRRAEGRNVFGSYGHSGLTPAMRRLEAQLERGQLLPDTESSALKPADPFKQRLADLIRRHPDKPAGELSSEVHDGIRYVYIFEAEHYADATLQVHSRLKGQGFELEVRRNSWRNPEHKGVNTRWRDPAHDIVFEVQFHTPESWDARQRADASYQKIMDAATTPAERARLRVMQTEISAAIPVPPRCTAIPDYRKEAP
jgi:hypothetical protein